MSKETIVIEGVMRCLEGLMGIMNTTDDTGPNAELGVKIQEVIDIADWVVTGDEDEDEDEDADKENDSDASTDTDSDDSTDSDDGDDKKISDNQDPDKDGDDTSNKSTTEPFSERKNKKNKKETKTNEDKDSFWSVVTKWYSATRYCDKCLPDKWRKLYKLQLQIRKMNSLKINL